jgi:type II secretion system protein N
MATFLAHLGPRARKALRYAGFALLALVSFVLALQLTFPFDRVKDKAIEALSEKYDVTVGDVSRGIVPARVYFKAVTLRSRPAKAGDVPTTFYIEQLQIDVGLFALLRGALGASVDAKIGSGHIKARATIANSGTVLHIVGEDLPSASLPVREALGLPMSGKVQFAVDLDLPNEKTKAGKVQPNLSKAEGRIEFSCPSGCTVGDGKSKLKLTTNNARQQAFLDEGGGGIDFGKINIDSLTAVAELKKGTLEITRFDTKSGDGDLHINFNLKLNSDVQSSQVAGCLRFRGSDALLKREPKTHAAISTTGAPLGPDNLFHIKLDGQLRQVRRIGVVCSSPSGSDTGSTPRPNLTVQPDTPRPGPGAIPMPPPPPQQNPPTPSAPSTGFAPSPPPMAPSGGPPAGTPPPAAPETTGGDAPHQPGALGEGPAPVTFPSTGSAVQPPPQPQGPPQPPPSAATAPPS